MIHGTQIDTREACEVDASGQQKQKTTSKAETRSHHPRALSAEYVEGATIPSKAKSLNQLLLFTTVENLLANGGEIISLKEDDTIEAALKTFKDAEIQSASVCDGRGKFLRILDIREIFGYFALIKQDSLESFFNQSIKNLASTGDLATNTSPIVPIGTALSDVLKYLATGIHHIGVLDELSSTLFNLISQLGVMKFIAKNISLMDKTLREMPVRHFLNQIVDVKTIPSDTLTCDAFGYLFNDNISAAAVVHLLTGKIIDTISMSDLVGVVYDRFKYLDQPVVDFLVHTRRTKALKPPITCHMDDTLEYVIMKLASTGVHRLWVVDNVTQLHYLGFVNLTNVLATIAQSFD